MLYGRHANRFQNFAVVYSSVKQPVIAALHSVAHRTFQIRQRLVQNQTAVASGMRVDASKAIVSRDRFEEISPQVASFFKNIQHKGDIDVGKYVLLLFRDSYCQSGWVERSL